MPPPETKTPGCGIANIYVPTPPKVVGPINVCDDQDVPLLVNTLPGAPGAGTESAKVPEPVIGPPLKLNPLPALALTLVTVPPADAALITGLVAVPPSVMWCLR